MTPKELNENELEKTTGGKTQLELRVEALDRRIFEGAIQCHNCKKKEVNMFRVDTSTIRPAGVKLECKKCNKKDKYTWNEMSIG